LYPAESNVTIIIINFEKQTKSVLLILTETPKLFQKMSTHKF